MSKHPHPDPFVYTGPTFALNQVSTDDAKFAAKQMSLGILYTLIPATSADGSRSPQFNALVNYCDAQGGSGPAPDTEPGISFRSFDTSKYIAADANPAWQAGVEAAVNQINAYMRVRHPEAKDSYKDVPPWH
jgi:hypothetical protein